MKNKKHIDKTEHKNNENRIEHLEKNKEIRHNDKLIRILIRLHIDDLRGDSYFF